MPTTKLVNFIYDDGRAGATLCGVGTNTNGKWQMELLTFQEPHKVYQGSFSVVRRVDTVAEGRRQHLNQFRAAEPEGSGQDVWYDTGISWTAVTGWLFMH